MANSTFGAGISGAGTVASATTAEVLDADNKRRYTSITIVAEYTNTGVIYVGGSDVASTTNPGLSAGDVLALTSPHGWLLSEIWLDSSVSGDGVSYYGAY